MLQYVWEDMAAMGFETLYLLTDHTGFYERYGWQFLCMVRGDEGELSRMYVHHSGPDLQQSQEGTVDQEDAELEISG